MNPKTKNAVLDNIRVLFEDCANAERNGNYAVIYSASTRAFDIAEPLEDCAIKRGLFAICDAIYETEDLVAEAWESFKEEPDFYKEARVKLESASLHNLIKALFLLLFVNL